MEEKLMRSGSDFFGLPKSGHTENDNRAMPRGTGFMNSGMNNNMDNVMSGNVSGVMDNIMSNNTDNSRGKDGCDFRTGDLPSCAPLAAGFVPVQREAAPRYEPSEALSRGTLFPGLDLPFMNIVNKGSHAGTPMGELMAISFVVHELVLYLDTHPDDREAFAVLQQMQRLMKEARRRFTARFGPITTDDLLEETGFTWTKSPWPWEPGERSGK